MDRITIARSGHNQAGDGRKETAMPRTHKEIIAAVLANLEMARYHARKKSEHGHYEYESGMEEAFQQAISLIKTEAGLP